jgi:hypothetical protein
MRWTSQRAALQIRPSLNRPILIYRFSDAHLRYRYATLVQTPLTVHINIAGIIA